MNVLDCFESFYDFENILFSADDKVDNFADGEFVDGILDRYDDFGEMMKIEVDEANKLRHLAGETRLLTKERYNA